VSAVAPFVAICAGAVVAVVSYAFAGSERGASAVVVVVFVAASGKCECGCFSAVRV